MARIKIEDIRDAAEKVGWKCLSDTYTNLTTPLTFECNEGHQVISTWSKMRNKFASENQMCPVCSNNRYLKRGTNSFTAPRKAKGVHRAMAVDQASHISGWAIFDDKELVAYGAFESTKSDQLDRILNMCDWLISMIQAYRPDSITFEETQYNAASNHNTFKLLSQLMGALMVAARREKVEVRTVLIPTWRGHCGVKGRTRVDQKRSAQFLVKSWYDISVTDDESDAICIGKYAAETYASKEQIVLGEWKG